MNTFSIAKFRFYAKKLLLNFAKVMLVPLTLKLIVQWHISNISKAKRNPTFLDRATAFKVMKKKIRVRTPKAPLFLTHNEASAIKRTTNLSFFNSHRPKPHPNLSEAEAFQHFFATHRSRSELAWELNDQGWSTEGELESHPQAN